MSEQAIEREEKGDTYKPSYLRHLLRHVVLEPDRGEEDALFGGGHERVSVLRMLLEAHVIRRDIVHTVRQGFSPEAMQLRVTARRVQLFHVVPRGCACAHGFMARFRSAPRRNVVQEVAAEDRARRFSAPVARRQRRSVGCRTTMTDAQGGSTQHAAGSGRKQQVRNEMEKKDRKSRMNAMSFYSAFDIVHHSVQI